MGFLFKHKSIRWVDKNGKRVLPHSPGSKKVSEPSKTWWGKYRNPLGNLKSINLNLRDKANARKALAVIEETEALQAAGLGNHHSEHARAALSDHVSAWVSSMVNGGCSERRREDIQGRVKKLIQLADWKYLTDITPDSVLAALGKLTRKDGTLAGIQTRNHYIQHVKQFVRWCVPERLATFSLAKLKGGNVNTDRRHDRRDLTLDEQGKLIATTELSSTTRFKLDGPSRAMLYDLAFATGFRRGELKSLTADSFHLESNPPTVTVAAAYSKHRQQDVQTLPAGVTARLKDWLASGKPLWSELTPQTAKMLRADLEAAEIPYVVQTQDGPLFADFHAMRHTFVSTICRTDAPIAVLMKKSRHKTPELTLRRYAKVHLNDLAAVDEQVPDPRSTQKPAASALVALDTGDLLAAFYPDLAPVIHENSTCDRV